MYLLTTKYHSSNTQIELFADKGDLHLCESSAEFLLEPWLLMQVPWHPAVYYQWLSAALAEVLKAKKQVCDFYWLPVPEKLFPVIARLLSMVETLHHRIISGFRLINWLTNLNEDFGSGYETNCHAVRCILDLVVLPSLSTIEFFVGDKFNVVVLALKRMACPSEGASTVEEEFFAFSGFTEDTAVGMLPALTLITDDLGNATHMFGKIGSLQDIKDELALLPIKIRFFPIEDVMLTAMVSYVKNPIECLFPLLLSISVLLSPSQARND